MRFKLYDLLVPLAAFSVILAAIVWIVLIVDLVKHWGS